MSEPLCYIKYKGFSCDGRGSPSFCGVTTDRKKAIEHMKSVDKRKPYSFGHVIIASEDGELNRWDLYSNVSWKNK